MIKDSGERRTFGDGAVRDIQEGKGACWLLPLDEVCGYVTFKYGILHEQPLSAFKEYVRTKDPSYIFSAINAFCVLNDWDSSTMLLELSKHFEEGAIKYEAFNWTKGIYAHCYVDSAIRHYLKWLRGDQDESHDRAFCWNLFCLLWTVRNRPEYNDLDSIVTVQKGKETNAEN